MQNHITPTLKPSQDITNHRRSEESNMNAKSCSRVVVVVMFLAAMGVQASAAVTNGWWCETVCNLFCLSQPNPELCYQSCIYHCKDKVVTAQEQCSFGCWLSKCHDPHPGTHENLHLSRTKKSFFFFFQNWSFSHERVCLSNRSDMCKCKLVKMMMLVERKFSANGNL